MKWHIKIDLKSEVRKYFTLKPKLLRKIYCNTISKSQIMANKVEAA